MSRRPRAAAGGSNPRVRVEAWWRRTAPWRRSRRWCRRRGWALRRRGRRSGVSAGAAVSARPPVAADGRSGIRTSIGSRADGGGVREHARGRGPLRRQAIGAPNRSVGPACERDPHAVAVPAGAVSSGRSPPAPRRRAPRTRRGLAPCRAVPSAGIASTLTAGSRPVGLVRQQRAVARDRHAAAARRTPARPRAGARDRDDAACAGSRRRPTPTARRGTARPARRSSASL